jgi:streptogramin lyase
VHLRPAGAVFGSLAFAMATTLGGCGKGSSAPTADPHASGLAPTAKPALAVLPRLTLTATIDNLTEPAAILATSDGVWVLDHSASTLVRIDPATNEIAASVALGTGFSNGLGLAAGRLWTFNQSGGAVLGVDPKTAKIVVTVRLGADGDTFAVGDEAAWLVTGGKLARIDGKTAKVTMLPIPASCEVAGLAVGGGFVWLASEGGDLCKIDEETGELVKHGAGVGRGMGMAIVDGAPWLPGGDNGLSIVDATTLAVATAFPPPADGEFEGSAYSIGRAGENAVIVGAADGKTGWIRYTGATVARVAVGGSPALVLYAGFPADLLGGGVLEAFGSLWVANFGAGSVERYELPTP